MKYNINDISPVYAQDKNILIMKSGSISIAYKLEVPEIYTLHINNYNEIISILGKNIFSLLPEQTVIHFQYVYKTKKNDSSYLKENTFLEKKTKEHFKNRKYLQQELFVYFSLSKIASYKSSYSSFIIKSKKNEIEYKIDKIRDFQTKVIKACKTLSSYEYFNFKELTEFELENNIKSFLNFNSNSYTDLIRDKNTLTYGKKEIEIFSVSDMENLPDGDIKTVKINAERSTDISNFYRPYTSKFGLEFTCDHIVNLVVYNDNQNYWKNELENKVRTLKGASAMSAQNLRNADINEGFLNDIENTSRKIVRFHYSIVVWEEEKKLLKKRIEYIESNFNKIGIKPYNVKDDSLYYLLGMFPGNASEIPSQETILTYDEFPFIFFNPEGNYKIDKKGFVFNDRGTQIPISVDVFDKPYKEKLVDNRNFGVIAPSGGGKSFLLKHILRQFIEQDNTKTVVINIGGDNKIARTYNEDSLYLKYEEGQALNINPFYIIDDFLTADKIEFLIDFIEILWKLDEKLSNDERSTLEFLIIEFYNAKAVEGGKGFNISSEKDIMNIKGFFAFIEEKEKNKKDNFKLFDISSLILNISKFAKGSYANLFANGKPIDAESKKYIEFELDNIKDHKILFPIFAMLISDLTFNTIWKTDKSKKMFFIDEAWKVLEKPGMASLIKYLYKTMRKFDGAVGIAVQQITDIPDNEMGRAITGNMGIKYLLNHSNVMGDIPILKDRLSLSERMVSMLLSVRNNKKGKYPHTEFLLVMGNKAKVLRLEVAKECLVIYESDKSQLVEFDEIYKKSNNIETAVNEFVSVYLN